MTATDEGRALYERLLTAWNDRDAQRFGELFQDDGVLIGFDGSRVAGSDAIGHLTPIFADHPTAAYTVKIVDARRIGTSAVMLVAIAGMTPPGQDKLNPAVNAVQTLLAEESDGQWSIVLFQNTAAQYHGRPDAAEEHTRELQELASRGVLLA